MSFSCWVRYVLRKLGFNTLCGPCTLCGNCCYHTPACIR